MNKKLKGALLVAGIIVCTVGLVAGVIVLVCKHGAKPSHVTPKVADFVCNLTDYKEACKVTMTPLAQNDTASLGDVFNAAILATKVAVDVAGISLVAAKDGDVHSSQRLDECKELMEYASDELHESSRIVGDQIYTDIGIQDKQLELMNLLSAVVAYQETCLDGFNKPELRARVETLLLNSTQLTSNALSIVASMPKILEEFNITTKPKFMGRKLLGVDEKGYPSWMSEDDKKLLESGDVVLKPHAVVAKDGSGQFNTIMSALAAYPKDNVGRYVVYVKEGIYEEYVIVAKNQVNVFMYGDGATKTIVTGSRSNKTGWATFKSGTFSAIGNGFIAKSMGFRNAAGPEMSQAVALHSKSDRSAYFDVHIDGYQDALYTHTHRQFYSTSIISGTVDFIFGDAAVIIQNCLIICKLPHPGQTITITAQGRKLATETTGIVIQNSHIMADAALFPVRSQVKSYLGRPWRMYSRTIVMESLLDDLIQPEGWLPYQGTFALDTCFYGEYANAGPGAVVDMRVKWKGFKVITDVNEAMQYTAGAFVQGNQWLKETGAPFYLGLKG
ncbi:pectinesterase [Artemisia annua]|uniref:Pectinesterase n=1 Tax=Artemisia annua TaxID=35608 RepID=A0A2U1M9E7_ARTAN|nr:pectinesterase [Artemisia annua]